MGPVFRGEDGETRDPVVIKVIRVGLPPERVAIVASALAALRERLPAHPALAPLIDTGVVDIEPYIVSPFIDGDSLDVALREFGPAHMSDALPRLRQLADAMDAAAAVGVAHGSLHLRDIVVSVDETVLTGIGIASILERVGVRPPVRRPYCAPEVALGHGISPAADQYALAAIAHEWLSGRRLSGSGASGFQVPAMSEHGTEALQAVFARAMDETPDDRFATASAFVDAIAELAGYAAPRTKSSRRVAAVEAPRLAFDEPAEAPAARMTAPTPADVQTDDAVVPAIDLAHVHGAADASFDPLDAPLQAGATPATLDWDPDPGPVDVPPAFTAVDDMIPAVDLAAPHDPWAPEPSPSEDDAPAVEMVADAEDLRDGAWASWAAVLVLVTMAALGGGWALLRWGTPTPAAVATATDTDAGAGTPASTAPSRETPPANEPAATPAVPVAPSAAERPAPTQVPDAPPERPVAAARVPASPPAPPAPRPATPAAVRPAARPPAARATPPAQAPRRAGAARSATPAAATTGRVLVRSTPSGAEVFVNGERRGVTPLALRDLAFGTYAVRVVRAGFTPFEQRVAIDAGRPARSLELTLTRAAAAAAAPAAVPSEAAAPGSLLVESRPAGARVTLDGAAVGVTPVTLPNVPAGSHAIRIERSGYAPITTTARVEARTRARVAVTLTAERPR